MATRLFKVDTYCDQGIRLDAVSYEDDRGHMGGSLRASLLSFHGGRNFHMLNVEMFFLRWISMPRMNTLQSTITRFYRLASINFALIR